MSFNDIQYKLIKKFADRLTNLQISPNRVFFNSIDDCVPEEINEEVDGLIEGVMRLVNIDLEKKALNILI